MHFFLGLLILAGFMVWYRWPVNVLELGWFPVAVLVQLILTLGFAFLLSALTVHFRDIKDILSNLLTLWFFATPIIYPMHLAPGTISKAVLNANPFSHFAVSYQEILFYDGPFGHWKWLLGIFGASLVLFLVGYFLFDRLRDSFAEEV